MGATKTTILEATGTSVRRIAAQRADGVWFSRYMERGPRGYHWTRWYRMAVAPVVGFDVDHDHGQATAGWMEATPRVVRLPKDGV